MEAFDNMGFKIALAFAAAAAASCTPLTGQQADSAAPDPGRDGAPGTDAAEGVDVAPVEDVTTPPPPPTDAATPPPPTDAASACPNGSTLPGCVLRATKLFRLSPSTVSNPDASDVCATLQGDGRLVCWKVVTDGRNRRAVFRPTPFSNVRAVDANTDGRMCVVDMTGAAQCRGLPTGSGTIEVPSDFSRATTLPAMVRSISVSARPGTSGRVLAALDNDSTVVWGGVTFGDMNLRWQDLGALTTPDGSGNVSLGATPISGARTEQSAQDPDGDGLCLLRAGTLTCAGRGHFALQSFSTFVPRLTEVAGLGTTRQFSMGRSTACAVDTMGTVRCWGRGVAIRATGTGANPLCAAGAGPEESTLATISLGGNAQSVQVDGNGYCTGRDCASACALLSNGTVRCWGSNVRQATGEAACVGTPAEVTGLANVAEIAVSRDTRCARLQDNVVKCWDTGGVFDP
jgi:hypothetical protein